MATSRDTPLAKVGFLLAVVSLLLGFLSFRLGWIGDIWESPLYVKPCKTLFSEAHGLIEKQSTVAAPNDVRFSFVTDHDDSGHVLAVVAWHNAVDLQEAVVAVNGVYGTSDSADGYIDHTAAAAEPGDCWSWYHEVPRNDAQPQTVRTEVHGLWPGQKYCFYAGFKGKNGGWSKPTPITCLTATWDKSWGTPARLAK